MSRNLLKGKIGDEINVLMAAMAWNLKKWLVCHCYFFVKRAKILCIIV
ncbi:hypothetical protein THERMOS_2082 [Bathymodiolus thermophilus thioautotrophic gill symbiont]|uniref:Transposase DDE domain-containing protein n=1 Tax=Bathymodiolus thermophilus thioautotrophic gill symbiont TaxID=2360 RepID=A0A8H9CGH9_9GAMM|nr:hypothetical protein THERMOS_2082 [Bathymodiolus thermophilus thioautotrophic gill symbiont]